MSKAQLVCEHVHSLPDRRLQRQGQSWFQGCFLWQPLTAPPTVVEVMEVRQEQRSWNYLLPGFGIIFLLPAQISSWARFPSKSSYKTLQCQNYVAIRQENCSFSHACTWVWALNEGQEPSIALWTWGSLWPSQPSTSAWGNKGFGCAQS